MVEATMPNRRHCLITLATLSFVALAAIAAAKAIQANIDEEFARFGVK
jgi:hypothetical protein